MTLACEAQIALRGRGRPKECSESEGDGCHAPGAPSLGRFSGLLPAEEAALSFGPAMAAYLGLGHGGTLALADHALSLRSPRDGGRSGTVHPRGSK
jgi:hypothetical protein